MHYRRYGGCIFNFVESLFVVVYPDSFSNQLHITAEGILVDTMEEVYSKLHSSKDAGLVEGTSHEILNNNVVWRTGILEDGRFEGLAIVFGKGDLYIYCSNKKTGVTIQDVVTKGKKVGYFEDDAVDIRIEGLGEEEEYAVFAVYVYNNQYFGPYLKSVQRKT